MNYKISIDKTKNFLHFEKFDISQNVNERLHFPLDKFQELEKKFDIIDNNCYYCHIETDKNYSAKKYINQEDSECSEEEIANLIIIAENALQKRMYDELLISSDIKNQIDEYLKEFFEGAEVTAEEQAFLDNYYKNLEEKLI